MSSTDKRCRLNKTRQQRTDELVQEELLDPSTNILYLFDQFNVQYFYGLLGGVEVKWTKQLKRLTLFSFPVFTERFQKAPPSHFDIFIRIKLYMVFGALLLFWKLFSQKGSRL